VIGSAGWAAAKEGYTAMRAYWERRAGSRTRVDAAAVLALVRQTCLATLGAIPDRFDAADLEHTDGGSWRIEFRVGSSVVTVQVDEYGQILHWKQHDTE
jgi:hypothetical protein